MLSPKRTKYRKPHRGNRKGKALRGNKISFGDFALQALEPGWITSRQIEAGRRAMSRYAKRGGKLWIRMFPARSITARAAETRMGAGKGAPDYWVCIGCRGAGTACCPRPWSARATGCGRRSGAPRTAATRPPPRSRGGDGKENLQ